MWRTRFLRAMPATELIVCVGSYALAWHLGAKRKQSMDETMRGWRRILQTPDVPRVVPLPHPSWRNNAWLKRNPWFEEDMLPELRAQVRSLLDQCPNSPE